MLKINLISSIADWMRKFNPEFLFSSKVKLSYLVLLLLISGFIQLTTPIIMGDTDMWYHLSDGKYFWDNSKVATSYFYSYYHDQGYWFNHFWGFQAIIYPIFEITGYLGLVLLRFALVMASIIIIAYILFYQNNNNFFWLKIIVFTMILVLLLGRGFQLRPHLFSYIFIPLSILVIEKNIKPIITLPIITLLWINTHGIEWVIGALIYGSYFIEQLTKDKIQRNKQLLIGIIISPLIFAFTPDTYSLITLPFNIPEGFGNYINELQPIQAEVFYSLNLSLKSISTTTAFTLLFFITIFSILINFYYSTLRLSHLIITIGGFYLLSKGNRFIWEWFLLNLPLVSQAIKSLPRMKNKPKFSKEIIFSIVIASFIPIITLTNLIKLDNSYPFDSQNLPVGIVKFLKQNHANGKILASANISGFIQQQLYPDITIHSDMKSDDIMFLEQWNSLRSVTAFEKFDKKYNLDFVLLSMNGNTLLNKTLENLDFKPVFIDETGVLYAHSTRQSPIVENFQIKFDLYKDFITIDLELLLNEIDRLSKIHESERLYLVAIKRLFYEKDYTHALKYANLLANILPNHVLTHFWIGNLYENLNECEKAIPAFETALKFSNGEKKDLQKHIGTCYYLLEDFESAYRFFDKSINIFTQNETPEDMFQFAFSSIVVGELEKAKLILQTIIDNTPEDKKNIIESALSLKSKIETNQFDNLGFFSWLAHKLITLFKVE